MLFTLENELISLVVDTLGAQMMHLQTADGLEYLWQGDPAYWPDRAPVLFPFIGRLTNNRYKYLDKVYSMGIHGFAAATEFSAVESGEDRLVLELESSNATYQQYPFHFVLRITYALRDDTVDITYEIVNRGEKTMLFGIGGHPGFNVPLLSMERFQDYELEFANQCQPDRVGFSPDVYLNGHDVMFSLVDNKFIELRHELFDEDAVILKNMAREVTLRSKVSGRGVRVSYPQMPYLGIWHWPNTQAPYVCIEPWSSLPSRQDVVEDLSCKSDLVHLLPLSKYINQWSITVF